MLQDARATEWQIGVPKTRIPVVLLVICIHCLQGLISSPHVAQWLARLKGERARGSRGGAVAADCWPFRPVSFLCVSVPGNMVRVQRIFVWQAHPRCLVAWRTRRPRVDLAVNAQGRDRPEVTCSASARPPKAPRTTSASAATPGTSPITLAVPGTRMALSTAIDAQPLELPPLRQDASGRRALTSESVWALRDPHESQAALQVFDDEVYAASSRGTQALHRGRYRCCHSHQTKFACWEWP